MENSLRIKFNGLSSENHILPMNQLGNALLGTDKIINAGLIYLAYGRVPKRGERFDLVVSAQAPIAGSVDIVAQLQQLPWMLPIIQDFLITGGIESSYRFGSFILTKLGGRPAESAMHLEALLQLNRDHLAARDKSDEAWRSGFLEMAKLLVPAAKQAVLPIGKSASNLSLEGPKVDQITGIDEPMADAIRSKEQDEVGDMEIMTIKVDGITHHNRQMKIVHPTIEGRYITAEVRDPKFDSFPNAYSEAASNLGELSVHAKPMFRNGELHKIYIMDLNNE